MCGMIYLAFSIFFFMLIAFICFVVIKLIMLIILIFYADCLIWSYTHVAFSSFALF